MWMKKRDVTKGLELLKTIREENGSSAAIEELEKLLTSMDARTGRRDPNQRKKDKGAK